MNCLITGARGFVAGHLAASLKKAGHHVYGTSRSNSEVPGFDRVFQVHDTCDYRIGISEAIRASSPDWIFLLAAQSSHRDSFEKESETWQANYTYPVSVFAAVKELGISPKILLVSSALVYGNLDENLVCGEEDPFNPKSPYALTKASAELQAIYAHNVHATQVVIARPFMHSGPGQDQSFWLPNIARQLVEIKRGNIDGAKHFNVPQPYMRDITDVRDVVRAYIGLIDKGSPGRPYNVGSGNLISLNSVMDMMIKVSGLKIDKIEWPHGMTIPGMQPITCRIAATIGWAPEIPLLQTVNDIYQYQKRSMQ